MNRFILQIIAIVTMTIDHIAMIFISQDTVLYMVLRIIGRIAFPLFCFLLSEGFKHTHSIKKYLLRILLVGLLVELFFYIGSAFFVEISKAKLSIFMTLFVGLLILYLLKHPKIWVKFLAILPISYVILVQIFPVSIHLGNIYIPLGIEYGLYGIALIVAFGLLSTKYSQIWAFLMITICFVHPGILTLLKATSFEIESSLQYASVLAIPFIIFYNEELGLKMPKWFMYLYYPLHLAILYIIQYLITR